MRSRNVIPFGDFPNIIGGKWCGKASSPLVFIVAYNTEHRLFRIQAALSNIIPFTRVNHDHTQCDSVFETDRTEAGNTFA